jgi:Ca-activated chloride channel family protein
MLPAGIPAEGSEAVSRSAMILALSLFLLGSCSRLPGRLLVMEGNFYHSQGMYTEAVAAYVRALDRGGAADSSIRPFAEYGLGAAYISLEEGDAALERFEASAETLKGLPPKTGQELSYRLSYNTGIVLFERGDYEASAAAFRQALEIDGSRIEAKRNLELSLLSLSRETVAGASSGGQRGEEKGPPERSSALFDYLRQKEQNQWKSREWIEEEPSTDPDY